MKDLYGSYLYCANLSWADFSGADLFGACLSRADLSGVDLSRANLSWADLRGADLRKSKISDCNIEKTKIDLSEVPIITNIHVKLYESINNAKCLDMGKWHSCNTTHCRSGWICHIAENNEFEEIYGTCAAAALIYMASDKNLDKIPYFFASNEDAWNDIKMMAGVE